VLDTDLFADLIDAEDERPPYRWILTGPERSGTGLHVDPVGTHAWVTVLEGCKRWVLFPPDTDRSVIGMPDNDGGPPIPSVIWFRDYYGDALMKACPGAVEVLQHPGETVYVPAGWPHLVLNVGTVVAGEGTTMTTAITHNYASELYPGLSPLWKAVVAAEPALAQRLLHEAASAKKERPDLYEQLLSCSGSTTTA